MTNYLTFIAQAILTQSKPQLQVQVHTGYNSHLASELYCRILSGEQCSISISCCTGSFPSF